MELLRTAKKLGNSAGVILPKRLLGSQIKITVVNRPLNLRKEVLNLLKNYLPEILGIYVINKNPIEVLVASATMKRVYENEKFKVIIMPLSLIKKDMKLNFILQTKLEKAETILNRFLLLELKKEIRQL